MSGLSKAYGSVRALHELSLDVGRGEIFGYLGPNGAGKTTTIRILLGFLRADSGAARLFGLDCWRDSIELRRRVGYLPGDVRLYDGLSGRGLLSLLARLRGMPVNYEELAEQLRLDLSRRIRTYSKGMKQKLGLIQALMHDPELLILDEPTSALDPLMQEEVYAILRRRQERGVTIFFSSHVLSEVEKLCHRVGMIRSGELLVVKRVDEMEALRLRRVRAEFADTAAAAGVLSAAGYDARRLEGEELEITVRDAIDPLIKQLATLEVISLIVEPMGLDDVFFELYSDDRREASASGEAAAGSE